MAIELHELRYLDAVAREGSLSAAARSLGVRQPTVSAAVAAVEKRLGGALFARGPQGVATTELGRRLLPAMRAVLSSAEELEHAIEAARNPRHRLVRVAFTPLLDPRVVHRLVDGAARGLGIDVVYKECTVADVRARLQAGQVDLLFAPRIVAEAPARGAGGGGGEWRRVVAYRDRLRYVPSGGAPSAGASDGATSRAAGRATVAVREIARERVILTASICGLADETRRLFARSRAVLREYPGQAMSYESMIEWAELGLGGAIVPESKAGARASRLPLLVAGGAPVLLTYEAVWNPAQLAATHLRQLVKALSAGAPRLFASSDRVWESSAP